MYRKNNQFSDIDIYENFNTPTTSHTTFTSVPSTASKSNEIRPMTSVKGVGFSSNKGVFDPLNQVVRGPAPPLQKRSDTSVEYLSKEIEKKINEYLNEAAIAYKNNNLSKALEKSKDALKQERLLTKHKEKNNLMDTMNYDLQFAVNFNLANMMAANDNHTEALNAYAAIVKNKQYSYPGRLRVNMGNIYYKQKKYSAAMKMYKMAMDQMGNTENLVMKYKIMRSIGNCLLKSGQFPDAVQHFEYIMEMQPDPYAGLNLVICYYALGDFDKMKKSFSQLISIHQYIEPPEEASEVIDEEGEVVKTIIRPENDELKVEYSARQKEFIRIVKTAARVMAPVIENEIAAGYDWVVDVLRSMDPEAKQTSMHSLTYVAMEMDIAKGVDYLKRKQFTQAIDIFKAFEKKEVALLDQAATNLSFLYFLEGDYKNAEKHAELAIKADRYNAKALVNRANCFYVRGEFEAAKESFLEAIGVEADCVEAIYNLGLVNKRLENYVDAMQAFKKLHRIIPRAVSVLYQIANIHELMQNHSQAIEWFKILLASAPTDAKVLARLGNLYALEDDSTQSFHNYLDSYRCYPVNMEVITWLGVWYVKAEMYEQAIQYFERASIIEPAEIKWKLMVASCYRRMSNYNQALQMYREIHLKDPENIECLRYLCSITKDIGDKSYDEYSKRLRKLERAIEAQEQNYAPEPTMQQEIRHDQNQQMNYEQAAYQQQQYQQQQYQQHPQQETRSPQAAPVGKANYHNDSDDDVGELLPF